jgi:hypothetical protein
MIVYIPHDKSKLFTIVDPMARHFEIENSHTQVQWETTYTGVCYNKKCI